MDRSSAPLLGTKSGGAPVRAFKWAGLAAISMVLAACGGAATPTSPPRATTNPITSTAAPASAPAVATGAPIPSSPASTAAGGDLCSLLSPSDLKTATGKTYLAGTLDAAGQCNWNTDASGANSGDLVILAMQADTAELHQELVRQRRQSTRQWVVTRHFGTRRWAFNRCGSMSAGATCWCCPSQGPLI